MRLLLTSDTHLRDAAQLPQGLLEAAAHADHIVHAGDLIALEVIDVLATFAPVTAVAGNVDGSDVHDRLPTRADVTIGELGVGVVHDGGTSLGRPARLSAAFPACDLVVFGHSHMPQVERHQDTWVVNPGSPTQRRRSPTHTFAWARLGDGPGAIADRLLIDLVHLD